MAGAKDTMSMPYVFQGIWLWIGPNPHKYLECIRIGPGVIFLVLIQKKPSSSTPSPLHAVSHSILHGDYQEIHLRNGLQIWMNTDTS